MKKGNTLESFSFIWDSETKYMSLYFSRNFLLINLKFFVVKYKCETFEEAEIYFSTFLKGLLQLKELEIK